MTVHPLQLAAVAPRLMTAEEAAEYFRMSVRAFERLRIGRVPLGPIVRYDRAALDAHLDALSGLSPQSPADTPLNDPEAALDRFTARLTSSARRS